MFLYVTIMLAPFNFVHVFIFLLLLVRITRSQDDTGALYAIHADEFAVDPAAGLASTESRTKSEPATNEQDQARYVRL